MGRRKKEPASVHRKQIASAAQELFMQNGIQATSMDDIARKAGYSKATLYAYFQNKEEIVSVLVLESMKKLDSCLSLALENHKSTRETYDRICGALLHYQEEFPFYFHMALDEIPVNFEGEAGLAEDEETFRVGEAINEKLRQFITSGIAAGELRKDLDVLPSIFSFWGMLSGLIQTAANKEAYLLKGLNLSKMEFLEYGFDMLYRSVAGKEAGR